jgi:hypothetical protein
LGARVLSRSLQASNHAVDVSELSTGIYRVVMQQGDRVQTGNLLIKR